LTEPLVLEPVDSGTADMPVIYQAAEGARPVFSGGRRIRGWQPGDGRDLDHASSRSCRRDWYFEQLFVDGRSRDSSPRAEPSSTSTSRNP
jgi:hypothetical protein